MKPRTLLLIKLLHCGILSAAEPQTLFFAKETAKEYYRISLTIEGGQVTGTQVWQPLEQDGAHGTFSGTITGDGIIKVVHQYTIEGSEQSEEELLKLDGDKLFIGQGELVEGKDGRMNLKDAKKVAFTTALKKVVTTEPKAGTPERKAIMDAMRVPVAEHIGKPVTFTGQVRMMGNWARFQGGAKTTDGQAPKDENAAAELELDFFALLKKDETGAWQVLHWGFAGDIGVAEAAREKFPKAPWALFE